MLEQTAFTQDQIEEWISKATGAFHYTKVMDGQISKELWSQLRECMHRAKNKGKCSPLPNKGDGWWRPTDTVRDELCWWEGSDEIGDNLLLPLGMNKFCYIPLPSLVIVAGKYNAGKTAMCINIVNLNIELWGGKLNFFVSEGAEMMGGKFRNVRPQVPIPPPFKMYRRTENFSDVIEPNSLNVIDYLRVNMEQSYAIGSELFAIFNKLDKGIAVVAMQKPPGDRKLAFGGASTAFEPTLYISMDNGWAGFEKVKVPKLATDPYSVRIEFRIENGVNFTEVHEVYE